MNEQSKQVLIDRMTNNLKMLRVKLNLSQEELAAKIGVSRFTIISIESKKRQMTWNMFLSLILIFTKNRETDALLTHFGIYTDELNELLKNPQTLTQEEGNNE